MLGSSTDRVHSTHRSTGRDRLEDALACDVRGRVALCDLAPGCRARIVGICDGAGKVCTLRHSDDIDMTARRLGELGFVPGALVRVIARGLLARGGVAVQTNSTRFGLNHSEARRIHAIVVPEPTA